jgi:glutamate dehydrogenase
VSTTADERATTHRDEPEAPDPAALLADYLRHVDDEDVAGRSDSDLRGMVSSHLRLAALRPQGRAVVSVGTPSAEADGWEAQGRTVIEIVTDDMPFLVDSVTAALSSVGLVIDLVVHPIVEVQRDLTGALRSVTASDPLAAQRSGQVDDASVRESWMHIEVERISDPTRREEVRSQLLDVLDDVRAAVEDWPRMRQRALDIIEELRTAPPSFTPAPGGGSTGALSAVDELREGIDLLQWLTEDHFTFLGYREYALEERFPQQGSEPDLALRALPGTGYGLLRYDQAGSGSGRLPPAVHAKAREPRLMILTKANSRSTVHRPAYLDYISVKVFDDRGTVVGERRFLGLFTSTAYTESIAHIPMLHRKSLKVLERLGYSPDSHSGKALLDICETYPRDELFQTSVDGSGADSVGRAAPAGTTPGAAVRAARRLRAFPVLPRLPTSRPLHHSGAPAHAGDPGQRGRRRSERRLHRAGHRVGVGPAALRGPAPEERQYPDGTPGADRARRGRAGAPPR